MKALITSALLLTATFAQPVYAQEVTDDPIAMHGEFELTQGEPNHVILHMRGAKRHRICLESMPAGMPDSTALNILENGASTRLTPGHCTEVDAKVARVQAASRLSGDNVLVGRFEHVRADRSSSW